MNEDDETSIQSPSEELFRINHGHSKDYRSDLKPFKIGLSVQEDGFPISGDLLSGNASVQKWNPRTVEELSSMLSENGYEDVIFLADSALISTESLHNFALRNIQFISRIPETFNQLGRRRNIGKKRERCSVLQDVERRKGS